MTSIFDVVNYILSKNGEMTSMKLQKLTYYSQAWNLAWEGKPLFDEEFEAWANGPVCSELFRVHKGQFIVNKEIFEDFGDENNLNKTEKENIDEVLKTYGDKEPYWLSNLTHMERPWKEIRLKNNCKDGDFCNEIIPKDLMQEYYAGL
ncbi:Uncharacterized phage-associated protein [Anaerococcus octavius]|uniref:Uncharacterized phage-associated protein n=1 Tax=Anaerococcus octavius TaxID=54007 RepID=A0A380WUP5_9FIRM|nr:type II toxin-antitoxin system antitoxin SocA domain-containing protein [Anaerococcus octavius]SUU92200.1 Uncharacterized phage-associated protein [Anaerococcus octavius]